MKLRCGRLVFLSGIVLCVGVVGCFPQPDIANRDSHGSAIICFGNSLTAGEGASSGHDYPHLLAKALGRDIINAGVSGDTTEAALRRLETDVLARQPRLVIVELGGNDFLQRVPLQQTFANLDEIVRQIQDRGAMVVLVGIQPGLFGDATRSDYQRIARARHAAFIPNILHGILTDARLKSDELHPNDAGYEQMAQRILRVVAPLL